MSQFQTVVNINPAPGVAGDFCSANPRSTVLSGPGALVAGANGAYVGRFAWAAPTGTTNPLTGEIDGYVLVNNSGTGAPAGFVHREQQALITAFLGSASMLVPPGAPIVLHNAGDFWAVNSGSTSAAVNQKVYASNATGLLSANTTGQTIVGANVSVGTLAANVLNVSAIKPNTATIGIAATVMTVSAVGSGSVLAAGQTVAGTGVAAGTAIVAQLTGTAGSTGTYTVSISQTVAPATAATMSGGGLTVTSMTSGRLYVGQVLSGGTNAVTAGTTITALGTGTGGAGTYAVSISQTAADTSTATGTGGYLTVTTLTGALAANDTITSTNTPAGTYVLPLGTGGTTGVGGIGTYMISSATGAGDTAFTVIGSTETKWYVMSTAAPGELMKISSWPLG